MIADTFTRRIPRHLLTSEACVTMPVGNDYKVGRHDFHKGDHMIIDLAAVPKHGDFVIVMGGSPFGRYCHIAPAEHAERVDMVMGTLDADGETIHMIHLGKGGREFGVVVNVLPSDFFDKASP